jgi:hypothetical protein
MDELEPNLDLPEEPPPKRFPWGVLAVGAVFVVMAIVALFLVKQKPNEQAREAIIRTLEKELDLEKEALQAQRDKVLGLTNHLDSMKQAIQSGQVENRKKAVQEYNKIAAEQRAEREKFKTLANQYNEKVAKLRQLE